MHNKEIKISRFGIFIFRLILVFLVLIRIPIYIFKDTSQLERSLLYGLIGMCVLFLFELISITNLSGVLYISLFCFVIALPLLSLGIFTYETGLSISDKIALPYIVVILSFFGVFIAILGITFVVFSKSILAGVIFLFLTILTILFLLFIYPAFLFINLDKLTEIKDPERLRNLNASGIGLYAYKKIFEAINNWIEWKELGLLDTMEILQVLLSFRGEAQDLLDSCCKLKKDDKITDREFDEYKKRIFQYSKNIFEIDEIEKEIKSKMITKLISIMSKMNGETL